MRRLILMPDGTALPIKGTVYLVGAGPGDPELLTVRALRLLESADAVLYDALVSAEVLACVRRGARLVCVGKRSGRHSMSQGDINRLLVACARTSRCVVRLKGGDPLVFGRGGEELEALHAAGIAFQIVPGITAATGVAAYAGIPLTHRDHAQSCLLVTAHLKDGSLDLDWRALACARRTLVIYMGLGVLPLVAEGLIAHGRAAATPVAVIQEGTTDAQRVVASTLADVARATDEAGIAPPARVIVGEVVALRERFAWFDPARASAIAQVA